MAGFSNGFPYFTFAKLTVRVVFSHRGAINGEEEGNISE